MYKDYFIFLITEGSSNFLSKSSPKIQCQLLQVVLNRKGLPWMVFSLFHAKVCSGLFSVLFQEGVSLHEVDLVIKAVRKAPNINAFIDCIICIV